MSGEFCGEVDLFGDPVRLPNGRRGRPAHRHSQKTANKIMVLLGIGWSYERIAGACHISVPTLKKHYSSELKSREIANDRLRAWQFEIAAEAASTGNVGAMRHLDQLISRDLARVHAAKAPAQAKSEKLGKKEQQRRDALQITEGGDSANEVSRYRPGYA